jgi:hypothetical protein
VGIVASIRAFSRPVLADYLRGFYADQGNDSGKPTNELTVDISDVSRAMFLSLPSLEPNHSSHEFLSLVCIARQFIFLKAMNLGLKTSSADNA